MKKELDPRTKLYMILIVSAVVMMSATTPLLWTVRIIMTMIPLILLVIEKRYSSAACFTILYAFALVLTFRFMSEENSGILQSLLTGYSGIVVQFLPALITAWYVIRTTKIGEFMSAMQRMHVPDGISISLAVVMRFFPTIKEEYSSINDAMRMRGIAFGGGKVSKMVEYRMIPLLFSCVNIGDELSAAAITRGLCGDKKRSSVVRLKLGLCDWLLITIFTGVLAIFISFKYIL
jgi:energy-coupling factor transport system permease protein